MEPTDGVAFRHSVVCRGESERKALTAKQLILMSPVAKKCSVDRPIRTERTESVTDWANRRGAIFTNPKYRGIGRHRDLMILSDYATAVCGFSDIFPNRAQKVIDIYPKVTNCSFKRMQQDVINTPSLKRGLFFCTLGLIIMIFMIIYNSAALL